MAGDLITHGSAVVPRPTFKETQRFKGRERFWLSPRLTRKTPCVVRPWQLWTASPSSFHDDADILGRTQLQTPLSKEKQQAACQYSKPTTGITCASSTVPLLQSQTLFASFALCRKDTLWLLDWLGQLVPVSAQMQYGFETLQNGSPICRRPRPTKPIWRWQDYVSINSR